MRAAIVTVMLAALLAGCTVVEPVYPRYGSAWVPGHYAHGYWVPGHWRG